VMLSAPKAATHEKSYFMLEPLYYGKI